MLYWSQIVKRETVIYFQETIKPEKWSVIQSGIQELFA